MPDNTVDIRELLVNFLQFLDETDAEEARLTAQHKERLDEIYRHDERERARLKAEKAEEIARTSRNLEDVKDKIDNLMRQLNDLDSRLELLDAHYRRARENRSKGLAGILDEGCLQSTNVLDALERMQTDYEWLVQQLPNLKPGLLDDIHCLVSKKRQAVYERLIILTNTAAALKEEAYRSGDALADDIKQGIDRELSASLHALDDATNRDVAEAREELGRLAAEHMQQAHGKLRGIFSEGVLARFKRDEEAYAANRAGLDAAALTSDIVTLSHINIPIRAYAGSKRVQNLVEETLPDCMAQGSLVVPLVERAGVNPIKIVYAPGQVGGFTEFLRGYVYDCNRNADSGTFACLTCDPRRNIRNLLPHDSNEGMPDFFCSFDQLRLNAVLDDLCLYERDPSGGADSLKNDLRVKEFPRDIRNVLVILCDCDFDDRQGSETASLIKSLTDTRGSLRISVVVAFTDEPEDGDDDFKNHAEKPGKGFIGSASSLLKKGQEWVFGDSGPHLFGMPVSTSPAPTQQEYRRWMERRALRLRQANHTGIFAMACVARLLEVQDEQAAEAELDCQLELVASASSGSSLHTGEEPFLIGTVKVEASLFTASPCEKPARKCEHTSPNRNLGLPVRIPRMGNAAILVAFQQDECADGFLASMIRAWAMQTPLDEAYVAVLDPYWRGLSVDGAHTLIDTCPDLFGCGIAKNDSDCEAHLAHVREVLDGQIETASRTTNSGLPQPTLLVVSHYPTAYTRREQDEIEAIVRLGAKYGMSAVLGIPAQDAGYAPKGATMVDVDTTGAFTPHGIDEAVCIPLDVDEDALLKILEDESDRRSLASKEEEPQATPIIFDEPEIPLADGSHGLTVPIGIDAEGNVVNLQIGHDFSHMIVTGTTGSGKSVFLHNLIESLCVHYAPSAVDLWLADFKKVEFSMYTDAENRYPQVSLVGIDASKDFIHAFINHLEQELFRRQDLINTIPIANDISTYNANVDASARLPRLVTIVDEFHHVSDLMRYDTYARDQFENVLREGRGLGMHVIVADQTVGGLTGLSETAFSLMGGRVLLKWKDRREVPEMLGLPADTVEYLHKGEGYLQADTGKEPVRFKGRCIPFGDIPNHEARVRGKLGNRQTPLISYDSTKRPVFDWTEEASDVGESIALGKAPDFEKPVFSIKVRDAKAENLFILDKTQTMGHEIAAKFCWDRWRAHGASTIVIGHPHEDAGASVWNMVASHGAPIEFATTVEAACEALEQADSLENATLVFDRFFDSIEDYQDLPAKQADTETIATSQAPVHVSLSEISDRIASHMKDLGMDVSASAKGVVSQSKAVEQQAAWDIRPTVFDLLQKGGRRGVHVCFIEETAPSLFKAFGNRVASCSDDIPTLFKHRIASQCARDESTALSMGMAASSIEGSERLVKSCYCDGNDKLTMFIPYRMKG